MKVVKAENYSFDVNGRTIVLDKALVDKYSDIVCPVSEEFLTNTAELFDKERKQSDTALSFAIWQGSLAAMKGLRGHCDDKNIRCFVSKLQRCVRGAA